MSPTELASKIDHTLLKPEALASDIRNIAREAVEYSFGCVCVHPIWVPTLRQQLADTSVKIGSVAGFPLGTNKPTIKAIEAVSVIKDGADEVDLVANLPNLINLDLDAARAELLEIVRAARAARRDVVIKIIIESAILLKLGPDRGEAAIAVACRAIRESGCDFVKTSTGLHPAGGATVQAVQLMKKYSEGIHVKAAGGIRDAKTALAMIAAGADRLGTSSSVAILQELKNSEPNPAS
jgi:deoxyribose-phosphate aldolase